MAAVLRTAVADLNEGGETSYAEGLCPQSPPPYGYASVGCVSSNARAPIYPSSEPHINITAHDIANGLRFALRDPGC